MAGVSEEGPYGIRTRAAAVRGRCPRPLDEWALRGGKDSGCVPAKSRLEGGLGLARVESLLEVAPDALTTREHCLVAQSAGRELHDADVVVTVAMTARVRRGLVEGPQAVALPPSEHSHGHLPEGRVKRNPRRGVRLALCDENLDRLVDGEPAAPWAPIATGAHEVV